MVANEIVTVLVEVFVGIILFTALYPTVQTALAGVNSTGNPLLAAVVTLTPILIALVLFYFIYKKARK